MQDWTKTVAQGLPVVVAALMLSQLLAIWNMRVGHPFDLEWMEGGMLVHGWRLQHGLPLYVEPSRQFIPYIYPIGYPALLAALGQLVGVDYILGRVISVVGVVAAAAAIHRVVVRETDSIPLAFVGAAMFLGCYEFSGAFYDLVRLDGLNIGLLAWAVALGLERKQLRASALLLAAAFLVKQHAVLFGLPIALGIGLRDGWRDAGRFALWSALPALAVTALVQWQTGGWYLTYLLEVPASHGVKIGRTFPGTPRELAHALLFALPLASAWLVYVSARSNRRIYVAAAIAGVGAAVAGLVLQHVPGTTRFAPPLLSIVGLGSLGAALAASAWATASGRVSWRYVYGCGVVGVALLASALMRGHVGGFLNVHMQMHWVVCLGAAFAAARWQHSHPGWTSYGTVALVLSAQLGYQGLGLVRHTDSLVPTEADRVAGAAVVDLLRDAPGPVWSPVSPWLAVQAGHEPSFHLIALWDIDNGPLRYGADDVRVAVKQRHWATIVDGSRRLKYGVDVNYETSDRLPVPGDTLSPKTGWPSKPLTLKRPVSAR